MLQIKDSLDLDHHQLKPIEASEETREPSKRYGLVKEETKSDVADFAFVEDAQYDCRERDNLTSVGHAQVKPAPAAMVGNEMCCDLVDHLVLTSKDMLLLTEGTNDIRTSDRFLHVGAPWCVNALANFMQLDISVKVRLRDFAHDWDHQKEKGHDLVATDGEYNGEADDHFAQKIHDMVGSVKDAAIKHTQVFCKYLHNLADGSYIKECIHRS